ncbi:MAG: radical SAM protein, partial [Myxococcota bacterium]|nr:radical SAM protein [Myxococcota bacterium]
MARQPCVLLISPGIVQWTDMDFGLPHLVSIGGWLRAHTGVRVEILDLNYEGADHQHLVRRLEELGPLLLVGLSAYSSFDVRRVTTLARFIRERFPDVPLVTGGYHASALPGELVHEGSPFDSVVVGEGERPMQQIVQTLLGGGTLEPRYGPDMIQDLDTMPPTAWDLLDRYWPRALDIGRKLQVYLSRGCPYHCTFCMERAKSGYQWRAFGPERAVQELERLATFTDLGQWVVNVADPLFGFKRSWRRKVLRGIIDAGLQPRQFWTLTRSDDLEDEDVELLARARFSIGIGMESGSPTMLELMQKGNKPDAYLAAMQRLARLSRKHGLSWAANIIVGHPGETEQTLRESHAFVTELFTSAKQTCGWLSIDPFRLYPGSHVHQARDSYTARYGTRFYHPEWWKDWYDAGFRAQHLDPSDSLSFERRVELLHELYPPLVEQVQARFRGQGRNIDRVFARSLDDQRKSLTPDHRDLLLDKARRVRGQPHTPERPEVSFPLGLHLRDPWVRRRELAVRRLLDQGVLRTTALVEALLRVAPE